MDPVFSHPAAAHDDQVVGRSRLFLARSPSNLRRHPAASRHKDQTLAEISLVKPHLPIGGRDAALVAPVTDPFYHTVKQALWV